MSFPGPAGYPDWQRVVNYDTAATVYTLTGTHTTIITSPVLDVSRYAYLAGRFIHLQNPAVYVTASYYLDLAATILVGTQSFVLDTNIGSPAQLALRNLGPFVQLAFNPVSAGTWQGDYKVFASNRPTALWSTPVKPMLIQQSAVALPPGGSVDSWPNSYYAGPVRVGLLSNQANTNVQILSENSDGTFSQMDVITITGVSVWTPFTTIVPTGAWKATVVNGGGVAGTFTLSVVPSLTGSS